MYFLLNTSFSFIYFLCSLSFLHFYQSCGCFFFDLTRSTKRRKANHYFGIALLSYNFHNFANNVEAYDTGIYPVLWDTFPISSSCGAFEIMYCIYEFLLRPFYFISILGSLFSFRQTENERVSFFFICILISFFVSFYQNTKAFVYIQLHTLQSIDCTVHSVCRYKYTSSLALLWTSRFRHKTSLVLDRSRSFDLFFLLLFVIFNPFVANKSGRALILAITKCMLLCIQMRRRKWKSERNIFMEVKSKAKILSDYGITNNVNMLNHKRWFLKSNKGYGCHAISLDGRAFPS